MPHRHGGGELRRCREQVADFADRFRELRFRLGKQGLVASKICPGLLQHRLIGTRVDGKEVIALLHEIAFVKGHLGDDARDL